MAKLEGTHLSSEQAPVTTSSWRLMESWLLDFYPALVRGPSSLPPLVIKRPSMTNCC